MRIPARDVCRLDILGKLWMPGVTAATSLTIDAHTMRNMLAFAECENVSELTRDDILGYPGLPDGDFSEVTDVRADFHFNGAELQIDWQTEESELAFSDCMFPSGDCEDDM